MNNNQRIALCNTALEACKRLISAEMYAEIHDFINKYNEWGLGMEMLIDTLSEEDIAIEKEQYSKIQSAMESMGLGHSDRAKIIMKQVKNT